MKRYDKLKVKKTTFEEEQNEKDDYFKSLHPFERWRIARSTRDLMRKKTVNYSYRGQLVRVIRNGAVQ